MTTPRTPPAPHAPRCVPRVMSGAAAPPRAVLWHHASRSVAAAGAQHDPNGRRLDRGPPPFIGESPRRDRRAGTTPPPEGAAAVGDPFYPMAA